MNALETSVQQILKDTEFPAFSQQIQQLMSVEQQDQSAQELANLVLQDFGLSLKVLQVANSFQYNRSSRSIDSISRAIMVMGVKTVQALASSLLFFDHFQKRSIALKRLMLLSMLSSHHASEAAAVVGLKEREEAQLAGMFRNLGEVLVACHFPSQYARIAVETQGGAAAPARACLRTLGYTYDGLARAIGKHWKLPEKVMQMWSPPESGRLDDLAALAQFGHDTTTVMYRRTSGDFPARLQLLTMQHGHRLRLSDDAIEAIIDKAEEDAEPLFAMLNMTMAGVRTGPEPAGRRRADSKPAAAAAQGKVR
ncbi:MAG: HDOD domain-containing protein [Vicinamibacterales bacterium]